MTGWIGIAGLAVVLVAGSASAPARAEGPGVLACDTLVNLRVLMGAGERAGAEAALPAHPGCRMIAKDRIGVAEHRAMVGGSPFECLVVTGEGRCAWVWP